MFDSVSDLAFVVAIIGGFTITIFASRKAVGHARLLAEATAVSPFIVGVTLFAVGTDLPEIANSIISSLSDHGDINVGDSVGSAVTQITLIMGLLPLVGGAFIVGRGRVGRTGVFTVGALLLAAFLFADGYFSRLDALVLISVWLTGSVFIWRGLPPAAEPVMQVPARKATQHALIALAMLGLVAAGAAAAVWGLVGVAESLDVPEYTLAFVVAAIGTSLPELVVDITALRSGATDLAVGGVFGASFVDSSLSMAVGPLLAPTAITASLAVRGALIGAGMVFVVALLLTLFRNHNRFTGIACIGLWLLAYVLLIG